jgi:hypothetical protein
MKCECGTYLSLIQTTRRDRDQYRATAAVKANRCMRQLRAIGHPSLWMQPAFCASSAVRQVIVNQPTLSSSGAVSNDSDP